MQGNSAATAFALDTSAASADRMFAKETGSHGNACYMNGATLTNSVCWAAIGAGLAIETDGSNTIRNVTAVGGDEAAIKAFGRDGFSTAVPNATDTLVNVIAHSAATGVDLEANSDGTVAMNINVSYSNYKTTSLTGAGAPTLTHINGGATNQSAAPAFVNAPAGNFHEAPGSPTIDAGLNDPANGASDLDGNARTLNGKTDIGAYEFVPVTLSPPDTKITKAKIHTTGHEVTAAFSFKAIGPADGFQCRLIRLDSPTPSFTSCGSPKTYEHLQPGHYIFEVRAFNSAGKDPTPAKKRRSRQ